MERQQVKVKDVCGQEHQITVRKGDKVVIDITSPEYPFVWEVIDLEPFTVKECIPNGKHIRIRNDISIKEFAGKLITRVIFGL